MNGSFLLHSGLAEGKRDGALYSVGRSTFQARLPGCWESRGVIEQAPKTLGPGRTGFTVGLFRVALGLFLAAVGTMMLLVPHQFASPVCSAIQPYLPAWGAAFALAGMGLLLAELLQARRAVALALHLPAAGAVATLGWGVGQAGGWVGTANLAAMSAGIVLAPFVAAQRREGSRDLRGDWLGTVAGAGAVLSGASILLLPGRFSSPIYDANRPYLPLLGVLFVAGGLSLLFAALRPRLPLSIRQGAYLAGGGVLVTFCVLSSLPLRAWVGVAYYGGAGLLIALSPWLANRLRSVEPGTFSVRLAFALAHAAAVPLVLVVGIVTSGQEQAARAEVEADLRASAGAVSQYIGLHRAAVSSLAAVPGLVTMPPESQRAVLEGFQASYPDLLALATYDAAGKAMAATGSRGASDAGRHGYFLEARASGGPVVLAGRDSPDPAVILIAAPVKSGDGGFAGLVSAKLDARRLAPQLDGLAGVHDSKIYLVNAAGTAIVHPDDALISGAAGLSGSGAVAAALGATGERGTASYRASGAEVLAAFAKVTELGWAVLVERPAASALAEARTARETAFWILLATVTLAAAVGIGLARQMAAPLAGLSRAAARLARGEDAGTLPEGGAGEVRALVSSFAEMRDSLAARGSERDRLLAELGATFASMVDPVLVFEAGGRPVRANPATLATYGVDPAAVGMEEFVGRVSVRRPDGRAVSAAEMPGPRATREKQPVRDLLLTTDVNGRERVVQISAAPLVVDSGVVGAVGVWHDVTEQVESQRRIEHLAATAQRRAAELQSVLDNMVDGVFVCDAQGRIALTNDAGRRLIGQGGPEGATQAAGSTQEPVRTLYSGGAPIPTANHPLARALRGETLTNEDLDVKDARTGREIHLRISAAPIKNEQGHVGGAVSVARDVTDLTELDRLKDQFIAVAAHELKTPVAVMKGYAQLAERRIEVSPERRKILEAIGQGADRIDRIVQDLLDISRLQVGGLTLSTERVDLCELVELVAEKHAQLAPKHLMRVDRCDQVMVAGDPARLEQVLGNLLDNAIRYSPKGGTVEVTVAAQGAEVVVSVRDTGVGIPRGKQAGIFQRFYRAHTDTPHDYGGMGVGLFISKEVIARHGGRMWFESEERLGSVFHFSLPLGGDFDGA